MLPVAASHHHRLSQNVPVYIIGLYSAPKNFNTEIKNFYKPTETNEGLQLRFYLVSERLRTLSRQVESLWQQVPRGFM